MAPAPQLHNDTSEMSAQQAEALRRAEEEAENVEAEGRTLGVYEEKKGKIGKITKKPWFIIDPRSSKFVPYWDGIGMVRRAHKPV